MNKLEIIKQLNQLSLQINNLIAALSESTSVDNDELVFENTIEKSMLLLGTELKDETSLFTDVAIELPAGEAFTEPITGAQEVMVDDGEELSFN